MGKNKSLKDEEDEARQERVLAQFKRAGRMPTPPPGHFHEPGEKQKRRKDRKKERNRLRDIARSHNSMGDEG